MLKVIGSSAVGFAILPGNLTRDPLKLAIVNHVQVCEVGIKLPSLQPGYIFGSSRPGSSCSAIT
jgi:hypothetical protein